MHPSKLTLTEALAVESGGTCMLILSCLPSDICLSPTRKHSGMVTVINGWFFLFDFDSFR